jgi:2-polyprenyl-3-methyl-5-hydroxy-6-metoxy-1,4-benzoquinol methylase
VNWDERYNTDEWLFGTEPSGFLVSHQTLFSRGQKVLAIGDGEGRNGVWLAKQGLAVTSIDISPNAIAKANVLAQRNGVELETICQDIVSWQWPSQYFDAIVSIFVHLPPTDRQHVNRAIYDALKPGGLFFLEAFDKKQLDYGTAGPRDADMLYDESMIRSSFDQMEIIQLTTQETEVFKHDGPNARGSSVQFVGRKKVIH